MSQVTTTINRDGSYDIKVLMDFEEINEMVREQLVLMKKDLESIKDPDMVDTYDALNMVIAYCSTPEQLIEMMNEDIDPEWVDIMINS